MKSAVPAIFISLALVACDRDDSSSSGGSAAPPSASIGESPAPAAKPVEELPEFKVGEEEPSLGEPTPGERLDHAIEKTHEGLDTAKEKTEEGLRKAAEATGGGLRRLGEAIEKKAEEKSR